MLRPVRATTRPLCPLFHRRNHSGEQDLWAEGKQFQPDKHPRKGRIRVPNTEDELDCGTENKASQEKVRVQQDGKNHRGNTN